MRGSKKDDMRSFAAAIKYCISLSWETSPLYTFLRGLVYLATAFLPFASMYASKRFIDILAAAQQLPQAFMNALLLLLVICLARILSSLLSRINQYVQSIHNELITKEIQMRLMAKSMTIDLEFFDAPDYMDAMQATMVDSMALANIIWNIFLGGSSVASLASAFIMLGAENWFFPIILVIAAIPSALTSRKYAKTLYEWHLGHMNDERKLSYLQSLASHRVFAGDVRLFNLKDYLLERYKGIWRVLISGRKRMMKRQLAATLLTLLMPETCAFIMLLIITRGIFDGNNTVGDYTLYSGLLATLVASLSSAIGAIASVYEDKLKVNTVKRFEARENRVHDTGKETLKGDIQIEFRNVRFRYPGTERDVLKGLSFEIRAGEKICLIGINGAGKSTIIKLLLRFYDVTEGQIIINGKDIREYTLASLRRGFSTFFQQYDKFAFSMRDNVQISDLEMADGGDSAVLEALHKVGAQGLLNKAPHGLDTPLSRMFSPDGIELSGGESQKIALARAVYRKCSMIIFDEPSASLDPEAEMELFESMQELFCGKTALFTSHRLSIVHLADRIFMLENGSILEAGSHEELMVLDGRYAKLYMLQASKYRV